MNQPNEYQKALEHDIQHFIVALRKYPKESSEKRTHLVSVMDQHLKLILATVPEIKRTGISKEAIIVERAYHSYMKASTLENFAALEHAVATLREYNC